MKALVTGGGGFLGNVIGRMLRERGVAVRSFSRSTYPALSLLGVEQVQGDLGDREAVIRAAQGCDIVYHVAAKAGVWGAYADFHLANVIGTAHVIEACSANNIPRLVHTSSPSVVFDGSDIEGGDESLPYPQRFEAYYPQTKAMAEQMVIAANSPELATVALRPHLIWGPGDNHLVPRIIARAKAGRLRRIGNRPCLVDTVYVDNAAEAHIAAAERLSPGSAVAGRVYFISNGEPLPLWDMVNGILAAAGMPPVEQSISPRMALFAGTVCETLWPLLQLRGEPPMTRFVAHELSTAHWFSLEAARRDLGYQPTVSISEGLERLRTWLMRSEQVNPTTDPL
ncbi:MAG: NAD-dependent epimerase/dehydratase family protein [Geobacter sp.]|nr:NAD-dependent epimerase/dehydratase family protein [Geobacter sp.]